MSSILYVRQCRKDKKEIRHLSIMTRSVKRYERVREDERLRERDQFFPPPPPPKTRRRRKNIAAAVEGGYHREGPKTRTARRRCCRGKGTTMTRGMTRSLPSRPLYTSRPIVREDRSEVVGGWMGFESLTRHH